MKFKSLKSHLLIFLLVVVLQLVIVLTTILLTRHKTDLEQRSSLFLEAEQRFFTILTMEKQPFVQLSDLHSVQDAYNSLAALVIHTHLPLNTATIGKRIKLSQELHRVWEERERLHDQIASLMPKLSANIAYIHQHHLASLEEMIRNNNVLPSEEQNETFTRTATGGGTELQKIRAAIAIQNSMLKVYQVFGKLQRIPIPLDTATTFSTTIEQFYQAVNNFEDYSPDAQDGLLVEELLLNGKVFEGSFIKFVQYEGMIFDLNNQLLDNKATFITNINKARESNSARFTAVVGKIDSITSLSLLVSIILLVTLLAAGYSILRALQRTVEETKRIQTDFTFRINITDSVYEEFRIIFETLNLMGSTVQQQLDELTATQAQLEERVAKRTKELLESNIRLKEEMEAKIEQERERRILEEQLLRAQKMEALGTLAGGVAHDLNNILSGIVSYPELILLDLPENDKLRRPMEAIQSSGRRAAVIVQDLLTMARRGVAQQEALDLNALIKQFLKSPEWNTIQSAHPAVVLKCKLVGDIGIMRGSKVHLQKTIMNLLANGAEAITREGTLTITTANRYIDTPIGNYDNVKEGEYIKLTIQDSGIGISEEDMGKIFEPFFTTKSLGRSGSGLGMSVVWGTVKDHGGYIDVRSEKLRGTTFDLYFPRVRGQAEFIATEPLLDQVAGHGETILVVDDVKEQREIAALMLTRLGYSVETVPSGEAAISYVRYKKVDLILLDMIMHPGIDGLETYKQIINIYPRQKAIIVSGFTENEKVAEAQQLGTGDFVKKPYSIHDIATAVRQELDRKEA